MGKLPWLKWSFDAWLRDPGLRLCSLAARAVWMDLLAIASASDEPGVIIQAGVVPTYGELAKLTGIRKSTLEACIGELEERNVFARDSRGAIYSRRMKRDADDYARDVQNGSLGGNPALVGADDEANPQQVRSNVAANLPQVRSKLAADLQHDCKQSANGSKGLGRKRVNPRVKAESDSDSESNKTENPGGFPGTGPGKVISLDKHRSAAKKAAPRRRGTEAVKPNGTSEQIADEDRALQLWNTLAAVSHIASGTMAPDRRAKLRLRLKEAGGLVGWAKTLQIVETSDLWQGRVGNGWKPCFDDILEAKKFRKLLEGGFSSEKPDALPRAAPRRADPNDDLYRKHGLVQSDMGPLLDMEDV